MSGSPYPHQAGPAPIRSRIDLERFLAATTNYEERMPLRGVRASFDLSRVETLLAALGHPERASGRVLHVAGSKGKGSVVRCAAHALRVLGLGPVGRYTSPHLEDLAERIAIDGRPLDEAALVAAAETVRPHVALERGALRPVESRTPTFFEILTAMGWVAFRSAGCRYVALEVGLGGRLDATNIVSPAATVVTHIEREHVRLLGDTLEAIATEKAGILKRGVPAIVGATGVAGDRIEAIARERGVPLRRRGRDFEVLEVRLPAGDRLAVRVRSLDGEHTLQLATLHPTAPINALLAYEALRCMGIPAAGLAEALADAHHPAVSECVPGRPELRIDGAHTAASAEAAATALEWAHPGRTYVLLLAMLAEKEADAILPPLLARASAVVATQVDSPRSRTARSLGATVEAHTRVPVECVGDPRRAWARARRLAGPDGIVLATGSLYLAGAMRRLVRLANAKADAS